MIEVIKRHLANLSASNWSDYKADLASNAVYEELSTRQRVTGADEYVKVVQKWKRAFPDLKAKILHEVASGDIVVAEVEWEGTHTGPFEGPFGTIAATNKKGRVQGVLVFTMKNGKIIENHHYFDLMTVLTQLGIAPMAGTTAQPAAIAGAPAPRHP